MAYAHIFLCCNKRTLSSFLVRVLCANASWKIHHCRTNFLRLNVECSAPNLVEKNPVGRENRIIFSFWMCFLINEFILASLGALNCTQQSILREIIRAKLDLQFKELL